MEMIKKLADIWISASKHQSQPNEESIGTVIEIFARQNTKSETCKTFDTSISHESDSCEENIKKVTSSIPLAKEPVRNKGNFYF